MAKKIDPDRLISVELEHLENKVKEFQDYLRLNTIVTKVTVANRSANIDEILLSEDAQDKLHKEIVIQIKMQDALFTWLPLLEKLKEGEASKELETRGDIAVNGLFKNRNNGR